MRIGAHLSISRGLGEMAREAVTLGCEAVQVFSRSPRGGKARPLAGDELTEMKGVFEEAGIRPLVVHVPYFLNLASDDEHTYSYTTSVLVEDMERAGKMGAEFLVTHLGHRPARDDGRGLETALDRVARAIQTALKENPGVDVRLLLENTAGQSREIGCSLEEVAAVFARVGRPDRTGICVDTCHAFAAGYDLRDERAVDDFIEQFNRAIGIEHLYAMHLNDAMHPLGSRRDRHQHIGHGHIGLTGFSAILNHPMLKHLPGVIETPVDSEESNARNLSILRTLRTKDRDTAGDVKA